MACPANVSVHPQVAAFNTSSTLDDITWYVEFFFMTVNILVILPLSVSVLYLGHRRWRRQRPGSAAAATTHSDFFTYNMAAMELIGVMGYALRWYEMITSRPCMETSWWFFFSFPWVGQMLFPLVISVDHYLAVVHPVTYLSLRRGRGVMIRIITAATIWAQCIAISTYLIISHNYLYILGICYMVVSLIVLIFCSLSVLWVLIRPRPGEVVVGRMRVDKSKQRAFHTILVVLGSLLLKFGGSLASSVLNASGNEFIYLIDFFILWISLPSSLVLPLIFLHRVGKLPDCKHNTESR